MKYCLLFLCFSSLTWFSCSTQNSPKEVAIQFVNARNQMDYETAKKFGNAATDSSMDWLAKRVDIVPKQVQELTRNSKVEVIGEPLIVGNTATVKMLCTIGSMKNEEIISLLKEADGKWYVDDKMFEYDQSITSPVTEDTTTNEATVELQTGQPATQQR